jgi:hypothetical protein
MRRSPFARLRFQLPVTALLLAAPAAERPVSVAVRPTVTFVGGDVRTTVRTPRDPRNRELRITLDAPDYYASSDVQLDGDNAAATHQFMWKELPGGAYRVEAILFREDGGQETFTTCFAVLSGDRGDGGIAGRHPPAPEADGSSPGSC